MSEQQKPETAAPAANNKSVTIKLSEPIARTGGNVHEITLRKPKAGELRGLKVEDLFATDINALFVLVPRISSPALIPAELELLEAEDLLEVAGAVKGFFLPAELRAAIERQFAG